MTESVSLAMNLQRDNSPQKVPPSALPVEGSYPALASVHSKVEGLVALISLHSESGQRIVNFQ